MIRIICTHRPHVKIALFKFFFLCILISLTGLVQGELKNQVNEDNLNANKRILKCQPLCLGHIQEGLKKRIQPFLWSSCNNCTTQSPTTTVYYSILRYTTVYQGILGYKMVCWRIEVYTRVYQGLKWQATVNNGILPSTRAYQGIQGYTKVY